MHDRPAPPDRNHCDWCDTKDPVGGLGLYKDDKRIGTGNPGWNQAALCEICCTTLGLITQESGRRGRLAKAIAQAFNLIRRDIARRP